MTKEEKKRKYCPGCYCNDYNNGLGGAKECWLLEKSIVMLKKEVHINQRPPWKQKPIKTLSCFHRSQYVYVKADQEC